MGYSVPTDEELAAMNRKEYLVYERRLRRAAERQGLILQRNPRRDVRAIAYGRYRLLRAGTAVADSEYTLSIADVDRKLSGEDAL